VLPIGNWSFHPLRSKLPPGAQLGFRDAMGMAEAKGRRRRSVEREDILLVGVLQF
jgi:hypothetical protein